MKKISFYALIYIAQLFVSFQAMAITTPNSFHFQAVPNSSRVCSATTSSSFQTFTTGLAANAPDVIVRNIGTTVVYYEIGAGGGTIVATVPSGSNGSQAINPGEADLMSKAQADTVACITGSSTGTLVITPGTGN